MTLGLGNWTFISMLAFAVGLGPRAALAVDATGGVAAAGWAEVEITPPLGIALGGRGGPTTTATKVLDPLFAQVLCLRDGNGKQFVLVSFDVVGLPHDLSDRIRTRLVDELGADWNLVVLNASHTHSGPFMYRCLMAAVEPAPQVKVDYFRTLEEKVVGAARVAGRAMQPVRVEVFQGSTDIGINRRGKNKQGKPAMLPNANGPFDNKVWVMRLTPENGAPPAVVFSCACHAVLVYTYAYSAISADFPGATRKLLREALGAKAHAQFVQGFAGDLRPRVVADVERNRFRAATPARSGARGARAGRRRAGGDEVARRKALAGHRGSRRPSLPAARQAAAARALRADA